MFDMAKKIKFQKTWIRVIIKSSVCMSIKGSPSQRLILISNLIDFKQSNEMKYFCAVFIGFAIIQTIPVESGPLDGVNNAYGSASAAASAFWNGQGHGSNQVLQNGPSSTSASARKNDISIDVDISQKQQGAMKNNFNNGFNLPHQYSSGNMNEQEMHQHISQYLKNMNAGSNIPSTSGHGHGHGHGQGGHQSSNSKNDISIDLDISTNSNNQNTHGKNMDPNMLKYLQQQQQQQGQNYVGLAATNQADAPNPAAPGMFSNALGSVGSAASSLKDKLWGSKENTPPSTPQNGSKNEKNISLDIDLDTDGDGKADQKINVDIDTNSDEKDLDRERNSLKSGHDAHMGEHDKGLGKSGKKEKKQKKQKIKNQKNKHVSNLSWTNAHTTNHYHPDPRAAQPSVVQIHLPPPMAMHHYNVPPPPMPPSTTYNSMNAAASSLSLQSTTVPNGCPYAHSHAAAMSGYGHPHGPMPPTGFHGKGNAVSSLNGLPSGMYGHADAAVNMQSGVPSYGAQPTSFNHMNQVPNMQTGPYNNGASYSPMHGKQNYYGPSSTNHYQQQMPQQYTQTPYH
ncbi:myb-like protein I [Contarinia nasturtii]|uniref:myb-like protein I n=1 Tax=Contarinia nasturtii TaxID=265458 RepID=UPI0012D405B2|nr:myb-like protein I [Contarinia nasturtii]